MTQIKTTVEINTPKDALNRLKEGNTQYIGSEQNPASISEHIRKDTAENGQKPYAVVVTCSDSRVPPEHIFSAGIGELFVIRTAGNVVADFELGSIEYGVEHLGAKVILVLGHEGCGAVSAAVSGHAHGYIGKVVDEIKGCIADECDAAAAENLNISNTAKKILTSDVIKEFIDKGEVVLQEAKYSINTGEVTFF